MVQLEWDHRGTQEPRSETRYLIAMPGRVQKLIANTGGYAIEHEGLCTTVFSAPNYVDQSGNKGAFVRIDAHGERTYTVSAFGMLSV